MHNHGYEPLINIKSLLNDRKLDLTNKNKFCALIANNPEGLRINLYNSISQYKQVDGYGNMFNRPLRQSKFDVLPEYKFCLCPENSIYDGYVTEKMIDAYVGGCVPLYSGTTSVDRDFTPDAFLNYQEHLTMDYFIDKIKEYDTQDSLYEWAYTRSLLYKKPKLDDAIAFVRSIVK
jgi:hypothetical protein